jgi:hypothetical protein
MLVKRNKELFLFDSNTFISAANQFYADDIALEFGVPVIDLYEMMKRLSIKL